MTEASRTDHKNKKNTSVLSSEASTIASATVEASGEGGSIEPGKSHGASNTLIKLSKKLFEDPSECDRFVDALIKPRRFPQAVILTDDSISELPFSTTSKPQWAPEFVRICGLDAKPGAHSLHAEGKYYCLDLSSVFAATPISQIKETGGVLLDVCASPGGKFVFASRAFKPSFSIANEVIGKRTGQLISNIKRCKIAPSVVVSVDPRILAEGLNGMANVVVVDAPCSGQSLLARGGKSPGCFHPAVIQANSKRQKRIIACSSSCVTSGGYLAYMTCTFSRDENEDVVEWFLERFPEFISVEVPALRKYQSPYSQTHCYRMWPYNNEGSGAFTALLQRKGDSVQVSVGEIRERLPGLHMIWNSEPSESLKVSHGRKREGRDRFDRRDKRTSRRRDK